MNQQDIELLSKWKRLGLNRAKDRVRWHSYWDWVFNQRKQLTVEQISKIESAIKKCVK